MPMTPEQLQEFIAKIPELTVDKQIKLYVKAREAKSKAARAADLEAAQFDQIMKTAQNFMLRNAQQQGVEGFKSEWGTTYTAETTKISIADDTQFFGFVLDQKDLDFFERRVSSTHVEQFQKANPEVTPPGLNIFREKVMRVRKANEK